MCAAVLALEAIVLGLSTPVMIAIADVDRGPAIAGGVGLAALALLGAGMLRHEWGYWIGHLVQLGALALGLVVPVMFVLGAIFAALWVVAILLGRRVEEAKAARPAASGPAGAR